MQITPSGKSVVIVGMSEKGVFHGLSMGYFAGSDGRLSLIYRCLSDKINGK